MQNRDTGSENLHRECFVCGESNRYGLKADLRLENDELTGIFIPEEHNIKACPGLFTVVLSRHS